MQYNQMEQDPEDKIQLTAEDMEFLRDEGLELFALYKRIRDAEKRDLVLHLIKALVEAQQSTDGAA